MLQALIVCLILLVTSKYFVCMWNFLVNHRSADAASHDMMRSHDRLTLTHTHTHTHRERGHFTAAELNRSDTEKSDFWFGVRELLDPDPVSDETMINRVHQFHSGF